MKERSLAEMNILRAGASLFPTYIRNLDAKAAQEVPVDKGCFSCGHAAGPLPGHRSFTTIFMAKSGMDKQANVDKFEVLGSFLVEEARFSEQIHDKYPGLHMRLLVKPLFGRTNWGVFDTKAEKLFENFPVWASKSQGGLLRHGKRNVNFNMWEGQFMEESDPGEWWSYPKTIIGATAFGMVGTYLDLAADPFKYDLEHVRFHCKEERNNLMKRYKLDNGPGLLTRVEPFEGVKGPRMKKVTNDWMITAAMDAIEEQEEWADFGPEEDDML